MSLPYINITFIGHVDCGKATTQGHLAYLLGSISSGTIEKFSKKCCLMGKSSFKFAWVMCKREAERERGISIEGQSFNVKTKRLHINLINTPGHTDFIREAIKGITRGDVGVLVVAAPKGEFEAGVCKEGKTRQHAVIAFSLGIKQLI